MEQMKTYTVGDLAMCDFYFGGKPTGRVIEVTQPGNGRNKPSGRLTVKITKPAGAYHAGQIVGVNAWQAVPPSHIKPDRIFPGVQTDFEWVKPPTEKK